MPTYLTPDVYIEELPAGARPIEAVGTSTAGFVGMAPDPEARLGEAYPVSNWSRFLREYAPEGARSTDLSHAVYGFLANGGRTCYVVNIGKADSIAPTGRTRQGLRLLEEVDEVAIVAAPGYTDVASYEALISHAETLKDRVALLDPPAEVEDVTALKRVATAGTGKPPGRGGKVEAPGLRPRQSPGGYASFYFPRIRVQDPLSGELASVPPSGHLAGVWARTDATRGVHKAPANEPLRGALDVTYRLTAAEQEELNPLGVNCLRFFTTQGILVWGARTLAAGSSEWRYLNVRRLINMIEESIAESTRWVVFEPNDQTLWRSIERDVSAFLTRLWRDGALVGNRPSDAFFVLCNEETNPTEVVDAGQVITVIGLAPSKPAEFVVFRLTQVASGSQIESQGGARA